MLFVGMVCVAWSQSLDIHKRSTYYPHTRTLQVRFEYYYDYWAEKEVKHGRYSVWYKTGVLQQEAMYEHNLRIGEEKFFSESGILEKICLWKAGKKEKESLFYVNSALKKERFYDTKGILTTKIAYYRNGKCKYKTTYPEGTKPVKQKFSKNDEEIKK